MRETLRTVYVSRHRFNASDVDSFNSYFHTFADEPFFTGGNGDWIRKTVSLFEDCRGHIRKVLVEAIQFTDTGLEDEF